MIAAVVLAAGQSRRMGELKQLLPLGSRRVIEWVIAALAEAGLVEIVVVTGHRHEEVEEAVMASLGPGPDHPLGGGGRGSEVRCVFNPDYAAGEMLSSIQVGLRALESPGPHSALTGHPPPLCGGGLGWGPLNNEVDAALLVLGDQPQLQPTVVRAICRACEEHGPRHIYIPTCEGRRGHPICLPRPFWEGVLALPWTATLRDFLRQHPDDVMEVPVETPSIWRDMDTREDYESLRETFIRSEDEHHLS